MTAVQNRVRVAAVQMPVNDQVAENLQRVLRAMEHCASDRVQLAVFPETALTGYSPSISHGRAPQDWPTIQQALRQVAEAAQAMGIWVALGTEAWHDDHWRNRLYIYGPDGGEVTYYDKVHLMDADTRFYQPGDRYPVFQLGDVVVGLQICYDARFPEGYRALLHQGAQIIVQGFYGAGGDTWKVPVLAAHLRSRAAENGCFVVSANVAAPLQIMVSQIVDPLGLLLAQANQDREEIITADLDLHRVEQSEIRRDYWTRFEGRSQRP
jgi:predicted amidohydrolase